MDKQSNDEQKLKVRSLRYFQCVLILSNLKSSQFPKDHGVQFQLLFSWMEFVVLVSISTEIVCGTPKISAGHSNQKICSDTFVGSPKIFFPKNLNGRAVL